MKLQTRIFSGLIAGVTLGAVSKAAAAGALHDALIAIEPVGTAFIRLITMVVVPLVIGSLFTGIASLGDLRRLGRIGGRTLAYFAGTTVIAATIGVVVGCLTPFGPVPLPAGAGATATGAAGHQTTWGEMLLAMIPQNPFAAAVQGDLLPLIVAVCIFAAAATTLPDEKRRTVVVAFERMNDLSMIVIGWLMQLAPIAVFVLIAATVAKSGTALLADLALFIAAVVAALAVHVAVVLLPLVRFAAGFGIARFLRAVADALILAFATASSSVTLPVSMAAATNRLGIPGEVVSFVLPAGATLDKNGAAVYKAVTAVFLATVYGLALGPAQLLAIVAASTVAAFAGAGVPGSSLVTTLIVLNAIGLGPQAAAGIALVAAVDRPLDMCRTAVNTLGNLIGAAYVARGTVTAADVATAAPELVR
ncbi:MAG TPA: dicarboxylate/amino acid:cation symporter [Gemmatimonadaceae bacterium]|nr:dicarboxylate/amino acid:cation symporter [Gemmatimonadaceae bacterium]